MKKNLAARGQILRRGIFIDIVADPVAARDKDHRRRHELRDVGRIVQRAAVPVFLAGGLGPDNVAGAVEAVRPYGVDVCSGLRGLDGRLDRERLMDFMDRLGER